MVMTIQRYTTQVSRRKYHLILTISEGFLFTIFPLNPSPILIKNDRNPKFCLSVLEMQCKKCQYSIVITWPGASTLVSTTCYRTVTLDAIPNLLYKCLILI